MKKADREMAEKLESVVRRHDEQITLATSRAIDDLRKAGFTGLDTIDQAKARLDVQRRHPGFAQWQIDIVVHAESRIRMAGVAA